MDSVVPVATTEYPSAGVTLLAASDPQGFAEPEGTAPGSTPLFSMLGSGMVLLRPSIRGHKEISPETKLKPA